MALWAGPQASAALQVHLVSEAQRASQGSFGGDQVANSLVAVLQRGDPEPHAPFVVVGPGTNGLVLFLHGPVQAWDSGRWLAPQPVPGWLATTISRPWPLIILPYGAPPPPQSQQGNPFDLVAGVVPGGGFVLLRPMAGPVPQAAPPQVAATAQPPQTGYGPTGGGPGMGGPGMGGPGMGGPGMGGPGMGGPGMGGPGMGGPGMGGPGMGGPGMGGPAMGGPAMGGPLAGAAPLAGSPPPSGPVTGAPLASGPVIGAPERGPPRHSPRARKAHQGPAGRLLVESGPLHLHWQHPPCRQCSRPRLRCARTGMPSTCGLSLARAASPWRWRPPFPAPIPQTDLTPSACAASRGTSTTRAFSTACAAAGRSLRVRHNRAGPAAYRDPLG